VECRDSRIGLWEDVLARESGPIDYLEFGVHEGVSLRYFAGANHHPDSRFIGFDTFSGLPESWGRFSSGHFNVGGIPPVIDDARVSFRVGLFQDSLPVFLESYRPQKLIVHVDCDLYSSGLFVLARLDAVCRPGTVIIFDEFGDVQHEFRAFMDYVSSFRRGYRVLAATRNYWEVAVEIVQ
jgi:hypothetical protein